MNATESSPTPSASVPTTNLGLSTGSRVGIGIGVGVGALSLLGALAIAFCVLRRRRKYRAEQYGAERYEYRAEQYRAEQQRHPQAGGSRRATHQEKLSDSAGLSFRDEAPRTIEESYTSSTLRSEVPGRTSLSREQIPTSSCRDPLSGDLAQGSCFKPSFPDDLSGSQKRDKSEAKTEDGPSSGSKLDGDRAGIQDTQDPPSGEYYVKDDVPDGTGRIPKASPRSDLSGVGRTALAVGDDARSMISRVTDVASLEVPSVSRGIGQSDAGGIAGAVVGGVGMAVGGGSFYYQRRQLKFKEKEIELRTTNSGIARREAEIELRQSQIEQKEASLSDESKQLKEDKQDLETKQLSLAREREALELQRRETLAKNSTAEAEFAGREEALKARDVEMCNRAKEVERSEKLEQDYKSMVQKKDVELQELTFHNKNLEASQRDLLGKTAQLSETLLSLEANERRWNSGLARLFQTTRALEDSETDETLDNISLSTDEMLREVRQRFDSLRNAHFNTKCTQRDYIEQLHRARAALASSEEEKRESEQNHKEEMVTLRIQCSNLKEQLRVQRETTISNSPSLSVAPKSLRSTSPSEEVDYNQEIQDALEQGIEAAATIRSTTEPEDRLGLKAKEHQRKNSP